MALGAQAGSLFWRISVDNSAFRSSLKTARQAATDFARHVRSAALVVTKIFGAALLVGSGAAIKFAADAEEAASKFGFVFKDQAGVATAELDRFAKASNRSRFELRSMAGDLQALIGPMGGTIEESSKMSVQLAKLATDLSSFFNVSESDALMALRAGIVGEAEPLRRMGVQLNAVKIEQEALSQGWITSKAQLTPLIKTQAIFNIITRETAQVQGDAERTAGSFTNQLRGIYGAMKDLSTDAAGPLLEVFADTIGTLKEMLPPGESVRKMFQGVADSIRQVLPDILTFIKYNKTMIFNIAKMSAVLLGLIVIAPRVAGAIKLIGAAITILAANPIAVGIIAVGLLSAALLNAATNGGVLDAAMQSLGFTVGELNRRIDETNRSLGRDLKQLDELKKREKELTDEIIRQVKIRDDPRSTAAGRVDAIKLEIAAREELLKVQDKFNNLTDIHTSDESKMEYERQRLDSLDRLDFLTNKLLKTQRELGREESRSFRDRMGRAHAEAVKMAREREKGIRDSALEFTSTSQENAIRAVRKEAEELIKTLKDEGAAQEDINKIIEARERKIREIKGLDSGAGDAVELPEQRVAFSGITEAFKKIQEQVFGTSKEGKRDRMAENQLRKTDEVAKNTKLSHEALVAIRQAIAGGANFSGLGA